MLQPETSYQNDYHYRKPYSSDKCVEKQYIDVIEKEPRAYKTIDNQTLQPYHRDKNAHVPFDLFFTPKPIIGTNPYTPILNLKRPTITRATAKLNTNISPTACLQDVEDVDLYNTIIGATYATPWSVACEESAPKCVERPVPDSLVPTNNPGKLVVSLYPPLASEKILAAKEWDYKNPRDICNRDATFWQDHNEKLKESLPNRRHIENLVTPEKKEEIREAIRCNKLRQPHDMPNPTFGGYTPQMAWGVPIQKKHIPIEHPYLSMTGATFRYLF